MHCVVIVVDFNIHVDNPNTTSTKELCCILGNYRLTQDATEPTPPYQVAYKVCIVLASTYNKLN